MSKITSIRLSEQAEAKVAKMMQETQLAKTACINSLILNSKAMIDGRKIAEELHRLRLLLISDKENKEVKDLVKRVTYELYKALGGEEDGNSEEC